MTRSMEDRLKAPPAKGWQPKAGDMVVGTITKMSMAPGTNWGPYPLIELEPEQGEPVAVHAFHTILRNEIEALQPTEGDRIGILYVGKAANKGGVEYENYRVELERVTPRTMGAGTSAATPAARPAAGAPGAPVDPAWDEEPF
jgi:hypothetical protein